MSYVYKEYPKTLYRWGDDGAPIGETFASADDVGPGWVSFEELGPPPVVKVKPSPTAAAAPNADTTELRAEIFRLKDSCDLLQAELEAAKKALDAATKLNAAYCDALKELDPDFKPEGEGAAAESAPKKTGRKKA